MLDDIARTLARRSTHGPAARGIRADVVDDGFDRVARAVAQPMSRRRALRLAAGMAAAAFLGLSTDRARAGGLEPCPPEFPQICGLSSCCTEKSTCCISADLFVSCCDPGLICGPIDHTLKPTCLCPNELCGEDGDCCAPDQECVAAYPESATEFCFEKCPNGFYNCFTPEGGRCCEEVVEDCCGDGCCDSEDDLCCNDGESHWCCPKNHDHCGSQRGECGCPRDRECEGNCCPPWQSCFGPDDTFAGRAFITPTCCGPEQPEFLKKLRRLLSGGPSAFGGAELLQSPLRAAVAAGSADALLAVGAVNDLAALAAERFRSARADPAYRKPVKVARPALAPLVAGPGLDASAAQALDALLAAEAHAWALLNAAAIARSRSLGAIRAKHAAAARTQARASGHFLGQAATALRSIPALRRTTAGALRQAGTPEMTLTRREVATFQAAVRRGGLPPGLRTRLVQLGLSRAEQKRVAAIVIDTPSAVAAGGVLIAPLEDAQRLAAITDVAGALARAAARSRTHPIVFTKPLPAHVRGSRPRTHPTTSRR